MECPDLLTAEERKLIGQLRQRIEKELPQSILLNTDEEDLDLYLIRWLRARDYNLDNATQMLRNHLQWRKGREADLAATNVLHPFFAENFPYSFPGLDRRGQPIVLIPLAQWDFRKLLSNSQRLSEFDSFVTKFFEQIVSRIRRENILRKGTKRPPVTQAVFINDVKDYPYSQLLRYEAVKKILQLMSIYEIQYPEVLSKAFFINCPSYFGIFVNMMKPVLSARTHSKVRYYSHSQLAKWKSDMGRWIDPSVLPEQCGGTVKITKKISIVESAGIDDNCVN